MTKKEQQHGGVKLTAKTARTLAMQEFGTARGLTKSTSFVGAYFMEFGNLRIEICADAACIAVRVVLAHGTGSSVKYFDPDTLQENFKAIHRRRKGHRMFARFQELRAGDGVPEHWRYFRHERAQVDEAREVAVYHLRHRRRRTGRRRKHDKAQRHNYHPGDACVRCGRRGALYGQHPLHQRGGGKRRGLQAGNGKGNGTCKGRKAPLPPYQTARRRFYRLRLGQCGGRAGRREWYDRAENARRRKGEVFRPAVPRQQRRRKR